MKRNFKTLLSLIIVLAVTLVLTGCNRFKYPTEIPTISNPKDVYMNVGDYKVSNEQIYYRNLVNYGVDTLNDLIDDLLLPKFDDLTADEKAKYEEYRNYRIYNTEDISELTEEEKASLETDFQKARILRGYFDEAAWEESIKLEYRRYAYAYRQVEKEIEEFEPVKDEDGEVIQEEYFTESQKDAVESALYPDKATIILLTFRSELEAKSLLESVGIYADKFDYRGWHKLVVNADGSKSEGDLLTETEVYDAFIKMYNTLYNVRGCHIDADAYKASQDGYTWTLEDDCEENAFEFTYTELAKKSSTIAKKVFDNLKVGEYTVAPNKYLTKYFLTVKVAETVVDEADYVEADVQDKLIENLLTNSLVEFYLYENRLAADLVIYDRGLEILYAEDYKTVYDAIGDEYDAYAKTKLTSSKNVATLNVAGKEVAITADDLYKVLADRYGVSTAIGYVSQFIALGNSEFNKVYNFVTGEILDQKAYDELYTNEIEAYKKELKAGTFEAIGYPSNYGWDNFLRDRFGVLNDLELIALGKVYDDALDKFAESRYVFSNDASKAIATLFETFFKGDITREKYEEEIAKYVADAEDTIQYQMQKIVDEFYSVNGYTVNVFADYDHNGTADEMDEETKEYANLFLEQIMVAANDESYSGKTYADRISSIVKEYNLASLTTDIKLGGVSYAKLKSLGIEVSVSTTAAYSSSTETDEVLEEIFKNFWNDVKDGKVEGKKFTSTTKTLDFTNELISDTYENDNTLSKAVVIKVTDYTYAVNSTKRQVVLPSEDVVERYLIVNKDDDEKTDEELSVSVTTREKAAVEAYYKVALKVFTSDDAIGDALIEVREAEMASGKISFANASDKAKYDALMEASK